MKKLLCLLMLFCISFVAAQEIYVLNSNSRTLSHIDIDDFSVNNAFAQIGMYGNQVILHEDKLFVVNSGDDDVQVIDTITGATLDRILLENSSNPYKILIHNDFAYVTCWMTGKLAKIDLNNTQNIEYLMLGTAPQGLARRGDMMYVTITNYSYPTYGIGEIKVVNLNTFTIDETLIVPTNPNDLIIDDRGYVHVICSGDYGTIFSQVSIFDSESLENIHTIELPEVSFFSTIQFSPDNLVFVGNALGLGFLVYDMENFGLVNDQSSFLFAGGESLLYDDNYLYVLKPGNYVSPADFSIYSHSYDLMHETNLGIGSNSMTYKGTPVSVKDIVLPDLHNIKAYPNPFNPETTISFTLSVASNIRVDIYNTKGQRVKSLQNAHLPAGEHKIAWNGSDEDGHQVASGIYFYHIKTDDYSAVKKMMLMK